jgi:hypothetical protein
MDYEFVKTEYVNPAYFGTAGTRVRVVMRSPKAVIWVNYGVRIVKRTDVSNYVYYADTRSLGESLKNLSPRAQETIDDFFGEGAWDIFLKHNEKRGSGTILLNGGGKPLPRPNRDLAEENTKAWEAATPSQKIMVDKKKCLECGDDLIAVTEHINVGDHEIQTLNDCQRVTNKTIVEIKGFDTRYPQKWHLVEYVVVWDGESYLDDYFCSNKCAAAYGRKMAKAQVK